MTDAPPKLERDDHAASDLVLAGLALNGQDDAALQLAAELARLTDAPLALLHAYPYEPLIAVAPPRWERDMRDQAHAALEALAVPLRATTVVTVHVRANPSPVRALHEAAEELGAAVIVAGRSHHHGVTHPAASQFAERLLHAAPCAVAIAPRDRATEPGGLRRIGVAFVDGPEGADALAIATGLAGRAGGRVRTFTVVDARPHTADAIVGKVRATVPADLLEAADVLEGRVADELTRATHDVDLLICGSRGYGPVRSLLLGGVSRELVRTAACPVLVVPRAPVPGFRTLRGDPA